MNNKILKRDIHRFKKRILEVKYRLSFLSTTNTFENNERKFLINELHALKLELESSLIQKRPPHLRLV